jgi:hypothetical protein
LSLRKAKAKPTPACGTITRSFRDRPPGLPKVEPGLFGYPKRNHRFQFFNDLKIKTMEMPCAKNT